MDILGAEIQRVQEEMAELYPHAQTSDLANARFIELQQELRELRRKQKDEKKGYF